MGAISKKLQGKNATERARLKAETHAEVGASVRQVDTALGRARVERVRTDNGRLWVFLSSEDFPVDPDGYFFVNPPVLVPDGTTRSELVEGGMRQVDNLVEDTDAAFRAIVAEAAEFYATHPEVHGDTTTTVFSTTADGRIRSSNATYATARAGSGLNVSTGDAAQYMGQILSGGTYEIFNLFLDFDTSSIPDTDTIDSAVLSMVVGFKEIGGSDYTVEARAHAWSAGGLTFIDWFTGADSSTKTLLASKLASTFSNGVYTDLTSDGAFVSNINKTGITDIALVSSRFTDGTAPTGAERMWFHLANETGTTKDPKLVVNHSASGATHDFIAAGSSTSSGSVTFELQHILDFTASGSGVSSGSIVFELQEQHDYTASGGSTSSGSIVFGIESPPATPATQFRLGKPGGGSYLGSGDTLGGSEAVRAFVASGASVSAGSIHFEIPGRFFAQGHSASSGSVVFQRQQVFSFVASGGSTSSATVIWSAVFLYTTPLEAPSPMSASIREATPTTPDALTQALRVNNTASAKIYTLLDVDIPAAVGVGAQILHADLILYKAAAWTSGAKTVTVHTVTESWDSESVTWNSAPSVGSTVSDSVDGSGAAGDLIEINVTELIQAAVAARDAGAEAFYGFRLSTDSTDDLTFASAFATPTLRPVLRVEASVPPSAPEDLLPNGGRAVSETLPLLDARFRDNDAEDTVSGGQWRISEVETMDTLVYDSGEVNVTSAQFDLDDPPTGAAAVTPLSEATSYFWDVRLRDSHGLWSDFSEVAEFQVIPKGLLVLDAPATSTVSSPTPTFSFTFTPDASETQQSVEWDLEVFTDGLWRSHWLYRRTVTSATEVTLPDSFALEEGHDYRLTVRVWDSVDRADVASDRAFLSDSQEFVRAAVSV